MSSSQEHYYQKIGVVEDTSEEKNLPSSVIFKRSHNTFPKLYVHKSNIIITHYKETLFNLGLERLTIYIPKQTKIKEIKFLKVSTFSLKIIPESKTPKSGTINL